MRSALATKIFKRNGVSPMYAHVKGGFGALKENLGFKVSRG